MPRILTALALGGMFFLCTTAITAQPPANYQALWERYFPVEVLPETREEIEPGAVETLPKGMEGPITPHIDEDFVVLGYVQTNTPAAGYHWQALTHVAIPFTDFNANGEIVNPGSWTGRHEAFQPGGAADRYGVKVLLTLRNAGFSLSILDTVMQDPARRATLIQNVRDVINTNPDNFGGISLDFEPVWGPATRDGITAFIEELAAIPELEGKSLSKYVGPTYRSDRDDPAAWAQHLDFMNISCYPWSGSWSNTATSIVPRNNYSTHVDLFLTNGCPPEKMVLTLGSYGFSMRTQEAAYGASKISNISSTGFADSQFEVTLADPLRDRQYRIPSESPWYGYPSGASFIMNNYEDHVGIEIKTRDVRHWFRDQYTGQRLRGVGFWSLRWIGSNSFGGYRSRDMETGTNPVKVRTYPHIYQVLQELLSPPGTRHFVMEKWEHLDPRWRNPGSQAEAADHVGVNLAGTGRTIAPAPDGGPENSNYALRLDFDFQQVPQNRLFFRFELLGHHAQTGTVDRGAVKARLHQHHRVEMDVYTDMEYPGRSLRMVFLDGKGELEQTPPFPLEETGWRTIGWDLQDPGVSAFQTSFNQYRSGDGVMDTAGGGERDLAFIGVVVEGGGQAGTGTVYLDELRYTPVNPGGRDYVINEFHYRSATDQFVEIYGPAGTIPEGVVLRAVSGSDGEATATISLAGGEIEEFAGGYGYFVVGRAGVPNVDLVQPSDFLNTGRPNGIQLYNTVHHTIYDSLVYGAFGGLGQLDGPRQPIVTKNGWPYMGEIGPGTDADGNVYTKGRYPDGTNTHINARDFTAMPATPGAPNAGTIPTPAVGQPVFFDFDTSLPEKAYQTYQAFNVSDPVAAGLPPSPDGGNAHRCVDTAGGGVISYFGDAALGAGGAGYRVTGQLYLPAPDEPQQAVAVGICGRQGSTFFTNFPNASGYEYGYWLIYENRPGVGLNNGRPDHPEAFEFVHAHNDNEHPSPATLLGGTVPLAATGASAGSWVEFELAVNPAAEPDAQLIARIDGTDIHSGPIPEGGPTSGAFQAGFRENHPGGPADNEGTWVDAIRITNVNDPDREPADLFILY